MLAALIFIPLALSVMGGATPVADNNATASTLEKRATQFGQATWFNVGLGACGEMDVNSDLVVALTPAFFGPGFPGPRCNQGVTIRNTQNGQVAHGVVRDKCPGCAASGLDLSPALFLQLTPSLDTGVIPIAWFFDNDGP
ncbi:hypothetical protein EIP91_005828 [Steccherinum ochraceum]|uniref:RlpA-like protein double-psi beta-barrel domain-containing protein n=1 Tax=Steccherinum ochraceum TaxID=92696 RepID=A0A4R0R990_9APHY|nr:hypothetical protein EIP91_005828 [Steccherinum ochraceum]